MKTIQPLTNILFLLSFLMLTTSCGQLEAQMQVSASREPVETLDWEAHELTTLAEKDEAPKDTESPRSEQTAVNDKGPSDLVGPGALKPTIYYFAHLNEDEVGCGDSSKKTLHGAGSKPLIQVCPKTEEICSLQGSCAVVQNGKTRTFNIIGKFDGQERYFEVPSEGCRYGYGVQSSCLDPFYTLAADLTIYKPGEVIFIPALVGLELPDGSKHDGYFVIRDRGHGIVGRGRFDFFTGYYHWADSKNPFKKIGLGDVRTSIPYFRVRGDSAKAVLQRRSFPRLPSDVYGGSPKEKAPVN